MSANAVIAVLPAVIFVAGLVLACAVIAYDARRERRRRDRALLAELRRRPPN